MMYRAKFKDKSGYWYLLDNADFEQANRFLKRHMQVHNYYWTADILEQETNRLVLSYKVNVT